MAIPVAGRVSIIIPAYNHQAWVAAAVRSVLAQTYPDWQLLIIDDGSSDDSWAVLQTLPELAHEPRIECLRHAQNQGAHVSLNEGLAWATGEYIATLNSDDVWHPQRLARLLAIVKETEADFVASDLRLIDATGRPLDTEPRPWQMWFAELKAMYAKNHDYLATLLRGNFLITTSNFFFHRRVLEHVPSFQALRYVHDYAFALQVGLAGLKTHYLTEVLLDYRLHQHNTIQEAPLQAIKENFGLFYQLLPQFAPKLSAEAWQNLLIHLQVLQDFLHGEWCARLHKELSVQEQGWQRLVQDRDSWITERDSIIAKQQGWIAERDIWIKERDSLIAKQQAWVADRDHWLAERDSIIHQLQQQQQQLLASHSYRLGKHLLQPMRMLRQWWGMCHA